MAKKSKLYIVQPPASNYNMMMPQYGLGSWLQDNPTVGGAASGALSGAASGASLGLPGIIGGALIGGVSGYINADAQQEAQQKQLAEQQRLMSTQNAMNNYNAQNHVSYNTQFRNGGFTGVGSVITQDPSSFYLTDRRKVRAASGNPIRPNVDLKSSKYNKNTIADIIKTAKQMGYDPATALAYAMAESGIGNKDANLGHVKSDNKGPDSKYFPKTGKIVSTKEQADLTDAEMRTLTEPTQAQWMLHSIGEGNDRANKAGYTDELHRIQAYNGLGKLYPNTESNYHLETTGSGNQKAFYGVPVTASGLDLSKNPLYGKEIKDLRDNVILRDQDMMNMLDTTGAPGYVKMLTNTDVPAYLRPKYATGGGIHIDPSKKGTFTAAATKHGKGVQAFASQVLANKGNYSPTMVKKANFAKNAAKWHADGGLIRTGVPYQKDINIPAEFPYNGQSKYKGTYNLKRALELFKPDSTGHLPSVDNTTGEWLKAKDYPTAWKEFMQVQLNPTLYNTVGFPIVNTKGNLQYTKGYATGGKLETTGLDDMTYYANGGTHEQNPNGGIPIGNKGLVEQGEFRFGNYIFSNRF